MFDALRFRARLEAVNVSQSELARRVGVSQSAIHKLASGNAYGSKHLHRIARELATTPAYLTGETDDPSEGAPPPPPEPQVVHVMLPVALPAKRTMTLMFDALLLSLGDWQAMPRDVLARELATLLPSGLGAIRGPLRFDLWDDDDAPPAPAEDHASVDHAPRRARAR